nr:MAG TPA: hypothetical protein [Caudoviricetes sp.]
MNCVELRRISLVLLSQILSKNHISEMIFVLSSSV